MNLLIDSHVWLWLTNEPGRVRAAARQVAAAPDNRLFLSIASVWEIAIKVSTGKLRLAKSLDAMLETSTAVVGYATLDVTARHALRVATLPRVHKDPFDRLLVAQALEEKLTLVTADPWLAKYGVEVIAAA